MCLQSGLDITSAIELSQFSKWILDISDGKISEPNDCYASIDILNEFLISFDYLIIDIVRSTYPNIIEHLNDEEFLQSRAILESTIETVGQINEYVLSLVSSI